MNRNKIITMFVFAVLSMVSLNNVYAEPGKNKKDESHGKKVEIKEERESIFDRIKELRNDKKELNQSMKDTAKNSKGKIAKIVNGVVTGKTGTTLTILKDGKSVVVNTDADTKITRHFWGKSTLDDIKIGHKVNVWGTWTGENESTMNAKYIRDLSIVKRHGLIMGTVTSIDINSKTIVVNSSNRGVQTVSVITATAIVDREQNSITLADIKVGHRIRIKGIWDKEKATVTETTQIKDFTLPVKPTGTVTPSVTTTVTPSVTTTVTPEPTMDL
ncbi:MAG TPA: DUF5666 domain-containing protein [Candidatus Nitrosocosmicus sp.]|nr:DUF5666 domain-containing protein [Candidatus Nitrosocosmicus sp.]